MVQFSFSSVTMLIITQLYNVLHNKFDRIIYHRIIFNLTTDSSIVLQSLFSGFPVSVIHWSARACDNLVISTLVSSLLPKSSASRDGMVRRMSGKCVNWLSLRFSEVHSNSWSKLSGSADSLLWDKFITVVKNKNYFNTSFCALKY